MKILLIIYLTLSSFVILGCAKDNKSVSPIITPGTVTGIKTLVWSDEFDYSGLPDPLKWSFDTDGNSTGW